MNDPPIQEGTARHKVLHALSEAAQRSTAQLTVETGLSFETVFKALTWLRERGLCVLKVWLAKDSLYEITQTGRDALAAAAQLALDVS